MASRNKSRDRNLSEWLDVEVPNRLPVVPLVSSVLFPGGVLSLQVGIERNVRLLRSLPEEQNLVAAVCQIRGDKENPKPGDLSTIGVLAAIVQKLPLSQDRYQLFLQGKQRIEIVQMVQVEPHFEAKVREIPPVPVGRNNRINDLMTRAMSMFEKLVESDPKYSSEFVNVLRMNMQDGPDLFSDLMATYVNVSLEEKQDILETVHPGQRLEKIIDHLQRAIGKATVDIELQRQIQSNINRRERENYLREQLRIIQDELGESNPGERETENYRQRVETLPVADEHREQLRREINRLAMLSPSSTDYAVIRGHLDTIFQMPWDDRTEDRLDLIRAEQILDEQHYGLEKIKERVLEFLAVLKLKGNLKGPILCFAGPPGVGKTSLGQAIADALGRRFVRMSVGGVTDESEIRGHRKTYVGAMPGRVIQSYIQIGVNNPLIMIDEIDKIGKDYRGDPAAALLEVLDPKQNNTFVDRYLEVPFDLSNTLFIATANVLEMIPGPLRDRMEVIRLAGYTEHEKLEIAKRHLLPVIFEEHGLEQQKIEIEDDALLTIIRDYTAEAGVRNLERKISSVVRKIARKVATDEQAEFRIALADVEPYLGPPSYEHEFAERQPEIGVATGLAWTSSGGEIMFIEATRMPGTGRTIVTGQLGDVMRESVSAAYSYVRSKARELEINDKIFGESDVHIHFPAGAIPKDGPSAGVAIATTIASVMGEKPVRHDLAMSGEITLRGKVLSVGGIKEKVLAAARANIRKVILPVGNEKDLSEVPQETRDSLEFLFAERVEDVWREALIPLYVIRETQRKYDQSEYEAERQRRERPDGR